MMNVTVNQINQMKRMFEDMAMYNETGISNCIISDVKTFRDEKGNLFVSYLSLDKNDQAPIDREIYIKFDQNAKKTVLNGIFAPVELQQMFSELTLIKLNDE